MAVDYLAVKLLGAFFCVHVRAYKKSRGSFVIMGYFIWIILDGIKVINIMAGLVAFDFGLLPEQ